MELSYSFHLSNDKNKTARAKEQAKKNNSSTTGARIDIRTRKFTHCDII